MFHLNQCNASWWRHQMKHFPSYWPFVRGIHRSPVNSPHKGQWRGALMFSLICDWINGWVNNREAGDWRRHHPRYDVTVMLYNIIILDRVITRSHYMYISLSIPVNLAINFKAVIILCMRPANERWRYIVTPSLIGWTHTQNDLCQSILSWVLLVSHSESYITWQKCRDIKASDIRVFFSLRVVSPNTYLFEVRCFVPIFIYFVSEYVMGQVLVLRRLFKFLFKFVK